jgi:outer membrane cobalamin receptor
MAIPGDDPRPLSNSELLQHGNLQMESYNLSTVFDLNFNATYKITNQFSVFAQLNNFGFQQYQRWLGYPVQSFNILGGLSYAF